MAKQYKAFMTAMDKYSIDKQEKEMYYIYLIVNKINGKTYVG